VLDLSSRICRFYSNTLYNSGEMKQSPANANYDSDEMSKTNIFWGKNGNNIAHTSAKYLDPSQTMRLKTQAGTTRADLISSTHRTTNHMPSLGRNLRETDQSDIFGDRPGQIGSFTQNFLDNECRSIRDTAQDLEPARGTPKWLVSEETGYGGIPWVGLGSLSDFQIIKPVISEESSKKKQPTMQGQPFHAIKKANAQKKMSIKTKIKTDLDVIALTLHHAELARLTESMSAKPNTEQHTRKREFCFRKDLDSGVGKGVYNLDSLMRDMSPTRFDKVPPWLKPRLEDFNDYYDIDENFILEGSEENLNPSIGEGMEQNYANNERLVSYIRNKKGGAFYAAKLTASLSEILKAQRQGGIRLNGIKGLSLGNLNIQDSSESDMKYCNSFFRLKYSS
jgi:hypothetical protein